jgi:uncharacterized protein YecE (DUF72 family)
MNSSLHLGCPVWNCDKWLGTIYPAKAPKREWLQHYSRAFNSVEGNSTFYGLPALETVRRWADETAPDFRFALKFPRMISHEKRLRNSNSDLRPFLQILESLKAEEKLGPSFLQLGPDFSAREFAPLATFLRQLPDEFPYAVEVRHSDWFDQGTNEAQLDELLQSLGIDRVLFDSRPLFAKRPQSDNETETQRRKPRPPHRLTVTGKHPLVRLIGSDDVAAAEPWLAEWKDIVARWIQDGLQPYFFTHAPDDRYAPLIARRFNELLRQQLPNLPPRPACATAEETKPRRQALLFE